MRAFPGDDRVGLLLFDEPSAHLDPKAELGARYAMRYMRTLH
jgi:ABC-type transport system involved in cytochrome bd biosynthesis fused ATPase/permease subunit